MANVNTNSAITKEENVMTNYVFFYFNGKAVNTATEADKIIASLKEERPVRIVKDAHRRKISSLARYLAKEYDCTISAAYAAAYNGGCRSAAERLLSKWVDETWKAPRAYAVKSMPIGVGCTNAAEAALAEEIRIADKIARKEGGKKHYLNKIKYNEKEGRKSYVKKAFSLSLKGYDRGVNRMKRMFRAADAMAKLLKEVKAIAESAERSLKARRVWLSGHNLPCPATAAAAEATAPAFKFDLQLFAARKEDNMNNHISSKAYVKSLKSNLGNALAYNVKVFADKNGKISAVLNREMAEITALNEQFLCRNFTMADLRGKEIIAEKAFNGYATLDVSACVASKNSNARNAGAVAALNEILIGSYKGRTVVCMRHEDDEVMVILSGKRKWSTIPMTEAVDENGHTREGWMRFNKYKLYSASKGRKNAFDMYEHDSNFEEVLNRVTYGEWAKVEGLKLNGKETAEAVTRLGSKSCRMGSMDLPVENVTILLEKDACADGTGLLSSELGIKEGYLVQCRPYTAKGAALVVSPAVIEAVENNHKVVTWDKNNLTSDQEEILDIVLNKHMMRVSGKTLKDIREAINADAICLVGNPDKGTQVLADLNFFKDMWDYERVSGLNVLDVACFTGDRFDEAYTSGQMMKLLLRAVKDSGNKELVDDMNKFLKKTIEAEMVRKVKETSVKQFDATELISPNYFVGAAMQFNSASWKADPGLFRAAIEEKVKSLGETMHRDRFRINGHSAMVTVDLSHFVTNGRHTVLNSVVEDGEVKYFEVFDPVANRYFEQYPNASRFGAVVKYPSMGTKEGSLVYYVSDVEMNERIDASGMTSSAKKLMKEAIANFKEGAVMVPNSLGVLAIILAGFDEDGDHLEMLFASEDGLDIPSLLKRAGFVGAAVKIIPPKGNDTVEVPFSCDSWAKYAYNVIENGNKAVGTVTNCFRLFTDGLLRDISNPTVHNFYKEAFAAIGCKNGKGTYKSVVPYGVDPDTGIKMYFCEPDAMQKFMDAIVEVDLDNVDNIRAMLDDMDKLGRFCQELTIDAQKKFYKVFCDWMDKLNNYSLFCLDFGLELETMKVKDEEHNSEFIAYVGLVENPGYVVNDRGIIVPVADMVTIEKMYSTKLVLADSFVRYRVYAINVAKKELESLISEYQEVRKLWYGMKGARDNKRISIMQRLNGRGLAQIFHVIPSLYTLGSVYRENMEAAKEIIKENDDLTEALKKKLERDIVKGFYADYGIIVESISNEIRRICKDYGMSSVDVAEMLVLDDKMSRSGVMTKILREERLHVMIKRSDMKEVKVVLRAPKTLRDWLIDTAADTVTVAGGMFYNVGCPDLFGVDVHTDLVDGVYRLELDDDGKLCAVRPGVDFIDMSNVVVDDDCRVINEFVVADNAEAVKALDAALKQNEEYTVFGDTGKRKYAILDKNGNEIVGLHFGSRKNKVDGSEEPTVLSEGTRGFTGKLVSKMFSFDQNENASTVITDRKTGVKSTKYFFNYVLVLKK